MMDWIKNLPMQAMGWIKEKVATTLDSSNPSIDFSHILLAVAFAFATAWLHYSLKLSKWSMTTTWGTCFGIYMSAIFAKGIWGKDGK